MGQIFFNNNNDAQTNLEVSPARDASTPINSSPSTSTASSVIRRKILYDQWQLSPSKE